MVMSSSDGWEMELLCLLQLTAPEGREGQHQVAALLHFHWLQELTWAGLALVKLPQDTPLCLLAILLCHAGHASLYICSTWSSSLSPQDTEEVTGQTVEQGGGGEGGEGRTCDEHTYAYSAPGAVLCHTHVHLEEGGPEVTFRVLKDVCGSVSTSLGLLGLYR